MRWRTKDLLLVTTLSAFYAGAFGRVTRGLEGLSLFGDGAGVTTLLLVFWVSIGIRRHAARDGKRLLSVPLRRRALWHVLFASAVGGAPLVMASSDDGSLQAKGGFASLVALLVVAHVMIDRYNRVDFGEHQVRIGGDHFAWATTHVFLDGDRLMAAPRWGHPRVRRVTWPRLPRGYLEEVRVLLEAKQSSQTASPGEECSD